VFRAGGTVEAKAYARSRRSREDVDSFLGGAELSAVIPSRPQFSFGLLIATTALGHGLMT